MLSLIPKGVPLTGGMELPPPVMTAIAFFWPSGAFLKSPSTDAGGGCPAVVSVPTGPMLRAPETFGKVHVAAPLPAGAKEGGSSLQNFFKFVKCFVIEIFNPVQNRGKSKKNSLVLTELQQ